MPGAVERKEVERYRGKDAFQQMLCTTEHTCLAYFKRAIQEIFAKFERSFHERLTCQDFARMVTKEDTAKAKACTVKAITSCRI